MYNTIYNPQASIDRINSQIAELEKMKGQIPPVPPITQNFQFTGMSGLRYAENIEEVEKTFVANDTPFFSKDMSVLWIKNIKNEIRSYELKEVIQKDEKDLLIESLQLQINELKEKENAKSNDEYTIKSVEDKKSIFIPADKSTKAK